MDDVTAPPRDERDRPARRGGPKGLLVAALAITVFLGVLLVIAIFFELDFWTVVIASAPLAFLVDPVRLWLRQRSDRPG